MRPGFVLQAAQSGMPDAAPRFGFTVTRKVGNAVVRNRIRRRLKELAQAGTSNAKPGVDYVFVGRFGAVSRSFAEMTAELASAFEDLSNSKKLAGRQNEAR